MYDRKECAATEVEPHKVGWLRRPELDGIYSGNAIWELPDGQLFELDPDKRLSIIVCRKCKGMEARVS